MSYILDALKKSDRSRQLNTTHEMSYSHLHSETSRRNQWLKIAAVLLVVVSLVVLTYLFFFNDNDEGIESVPSLQMATEIIEPASKYIPPNNSSAQPNKTADPEPVTAQRSTLSDLTQTMTAPSKVTASSKDNASAAGSDFTGYDNYRAVRSQYGLPSLHLDILMYHPELPKRKAYINMSVYRQGDRTKEGAEVMKIGKNGVLLRYNEHDFVLTAN